MFPVPKTSNACRSITVAHDVVGVAISTGLGIEGISSEPETYQRVKHLLDEGISYPLK
jgi:hypothetical protein